VGLNPSLRLRITSRRKPLRSTRRELELAGNREQELGANGERGWGTDEVSRAGSREETPEAKPWTWQRDETSPQGNQRSKPSRARETLRAERRWEWDPIGLWTLRAGVASRDETPRKALGVVTHRADQELDEL